MIQTQEYSPVSVSWESLVAVKARARGVLLKASRQAVRDGVGESKSVFKTRGLDFQEVRAYQAGDDIRQIDWRVTARYGKPFTKLYMEEKERPVYLVCDLRSQMKFASRGDFKSVMAARMTVFLASISLQKRDRVFVMLLLPEMIQTLSLTGEEGFSELMTALSKASAPENRPVSRISLALALENLERAVKSGAFVFVLSDFHDFGKAESECLARIGMRKTVALVRVYDELETALPSGVWTMTDGIQTLTINAENKSARLSFQESFSRQTELIQKEALRYGWGYLPVRTDDDYLNLLARFSRSEKR